MSAQHKIKRSWHGRRRFRAHCSCGHFEARGHSSAVISLACAAHRDETKPAPRKRFSRKAKESTDA